MSFSEAFFALLPPLHAILRGVVVLTKGASDERVYGLSARLPDEPAHMGCQTLAHLREAACPGALGSPRSPLEAPFGARRRGKGHGGHTERAREGACADAD